MYCDFTEVTCSTKAKKILVVGHEHKKIIGEIKVYDLHEYRFNSWYSYIWYSDNELREISKYLRKLNKGEP